MKARISCALFLLLLVPGYSPGQDTGAWISRQEPAYTVHYKQQDRDELNSYLKLLDAGIRLNELFFGNRYLRHFSVFIYPDRHSLDSAWQAEWKMPEFKSECWMVASGTGGKMDWLSPLTWEREACEHRYADYESTRKLIAHELVHVYHGQHNPSPDFSETEKIDWFVEGLATFASEQCDSTRLAGVRGAITKNEIPTTLDQFWTGKNKYGLSGSMVMFIDHKYGRAKLTGLLRLTRKDQVLEALSISEESLLKEWKQYILQK